MEQFKVCEKETKTKAFSKEGLAKAAQLTPAQKARRKTRRMARGWIESLEQQVDEMEAELETLSSVRKKKQDKTQVCDVAGCL